MGFLDETANLLGIDEKTQNQTFVYSTNHSLVVEGYKKILEFSQVKVSLLCEENRLEIWGNNLKIKELSHSELSIAGEIKTISFVG